jgi:histidinol-phosphatase (PHP family)
VDSNEEIDRICQQAILKGVKGIAITDHVAIWRCPNLSFVNDLNNCKKEIHELREKYKGKLKILFGMEISEHHLNQSYVDTALNVKDIDVVLCSLHDDISISSMKLNIHFIENDFRNVSNDIRLQIIKKYYAMLKDVVKTSDYDVLAHLTYPFRYICLRDKIDFDFSLIKEDIKDILSIIINRKKALELNTSNATDGFFMPDKNILKLYKEMGGELITLGSDAHVAQKVDSGILLGKELLKNCGFTKYYYYEKRIPKVAATL